MYKDKDKEKQYKRLYYLKNKKALLEKKRRQRLSLKEFLREYKNECECIKCGENHPVCLDFHHRDPKKKESMIAQLVSTGWCKERILKEIEKCDVLCANCHRKLHFE